MKAIFASVFLFVCLSFQCIYAGPHKRAESGEKETVKFAYDSHTHMMMLVRQATCYIFVLTDAEKAMVHSDAGIRQVELTLLVRINDPNLGLTTVPHNSLHQNILRECGKGIAQYHIIQ